MKVSVIGLRGIPDVQGGVEAHVEHLYPRIVDAGWEVLVIGRSKHMSADRTEYRGVRCKVLPSVRMSGVEAFLHTLLGVLYCAVRRPDILHIHAIGPSIWAPVARLLGLRVVSTHHGADYQRQKWGHVAKGVLRLGEALGALTSNRVIAVSRSIQRHLSDAYGVQAAFIPNGVEVWPMVAASSEQLQFGLERGKYLLHVGRIVPEKRHLDLISAFRILRTMSGFEDWKLAIVGNVERCLGYSAMVVESASAVEGVVLTGFQCGEALCKLYREAGAFALPSSHEGLAMALLEALSFGLPVVASDIEANKEVEAPGVRYFQLGNVEAMARQIVSAVSQGSSEVQRYRRREFVSRHYNWEHVARQTCSVYEQVLGIGAPDSALPDVGAKHAPDPLASKQKSA